MESASTAPLVSIIIPVYKVEEYLPRCLDSILAQTYPHWEALCIDDGSPDRCGEILDAYAARDSHFRVLHQENGGVSAARNAGLDMMRGEYLTMVDADDSVEPELLEKMVAVMEKYGPSLVCSGYYNHDEAGATLYIAPLRGGAPQGISTSPLTRAALYNVKSITCTKLFRTSTWRAAGLRFTPGCAFGEDHAVLLRYLMHSSSMATINEPLYHYYRREDSATRTFEAQLRSAASYIDSFQTLAHTVDSLPEGAGADFRGMWHYVVLRRFERTVNELYVDQHPEYAAIRAAVNECQRYLKKGLTLKYRLAWCKHRLMVFKGRAKQGIRRVLQYPERRRMARFSNPAHQRKILRRVLAKWERIRKQEVIHAVFQVYHIGMWKNDSLMRLMLEHPRFKPVIWIVSHYDNWPTEQNMQDIREHCRALGFPYVEYPDLATLRRRQPVDLFFFMEPYDFNLTRKRDRGMTDLVLCYAPYCFRNHGQAEELNNPLQNMAAFNFFENDCVERAARSITNNHGERNFVTGQPMVDVFLDSSLSAALPSPWKDCGKPMKKVIWAPHWTFFKVPGFLCTSTFMLVYEIMVELAEKYADCIQFAFKPHPSLRHNLMRDDVWGKERTEAYYRKWEREMPNTQYENGDYAALFRHSDAMIHDCGSFMLEYLLVDKPCMFLQEGEGFPLLNEMSRDALSAYYKGVTREEIEHFLQNCVLGGEDAHAAERRTVREKHLLPPNNRSAAENIISTLLNEP